MKEYIKLFNTPSDADFYVVKDVPFISTVNSTGLNIRCSTSKYLVNDDSVIRSYDYDPTKAMLFLSDKTGVLVDSATQSNISTLYKNTLKKAIIGNLITSIESRAFYSCSNLTNIEIPNSVTSIEDKAFYNCSGLTSVTIPNSVTSIGNSAFSNVANIVYYGEATGSPWGAKSINGYVEDFLVYNNETKTTLRACSSSAIGEIVIPNSVTSIGNSAFNGCTGLTSVTIPNSVTSIGSSTFNGCTGLTSVTIPNSVTSIGGWAFSDCYGLTSVTIPSSVTSIGDYAFGSCINLTSVTIGNSVTSIGNNAFRNCWGLTSVTIPNSVTSIGDWAFQGCSGLTIVTCKATTPPTLGSSAIPDNVTTIYVPSGSAGTYKATSWWSTFANKIQEI